MDDILSDDAMFALEPDVCAGGVETITLVVTGSSTATISAVVDRLPPVEMSDGSVIPAWQFFVANDSSIGTLPSRLRSSGAYIICALNTSESGASDRIYVNDGAVSQDQGGIVIRSPRIG